MVSDTLSGQRVVVVGGSSGIGLATAQAAASAGADVVVVARGTDALTRVEATVPGVATAAADVLDEDALRKVAAAYERVDHVYVSAGSTRLGSILDDSPVATQLAALRVRLDGAAQVIRAFHPVLRSDGSVTLTGGVSTDRPVRGAWVSGVGTAAAEQLARVMAVELAPLRFNAVSPGWTDTPMWDAVLGDEKSGVLTEAAAGLLTGRLVTADEVAAAVLFLMTSPSVTGEIVHIDGGGRLT